MNTARNLRLIIDSKIVKTKRTRKPTRAEILTILADNQPNTTLEIKIRHLQENPTTFAKTREQ
jgi:hypothetical protein